MAMDERYNLVLAFARVLFINGQATEQTVAAAERLGRRLGLARDHRRACAMIDDTRHPGGEGPSRACDRRGHLLRSFWPRC
jgi:hypothetical protein